MFSEFVCFSSLYYRLLSGEFFPLLCCGFADRFFSPCSHVVGMCFCKARRFAEALRSSWIFTFALFLFASAFFGLVCSARTHSLVFTPQDLFKRFEILPRSVIVIVCSDRELTVDLGGLRKRT